MHTLIKHIPYMMTFIQCYVGKKKRMTSISLICYSRVCLCVCVKK